LSAGLRQTPSWIKGSLLLREEDGKGVEGRKTRGGRRREEIEGEGEWKGEGRGRG